MSLGSLLGPKAVILTQDSVNETYEVGQHQPIPGSECQALGEGKDVRSTILRTVTIRLPTAKSGCGRRFKRHNSLDGIPEWNPSIVYNVLDCLQSPQVIILPKNPHQRRKYALEPWAYPSSPPIPGHVDNSYLKLLHMETLYLTTTRHFTFQQALTLTLWDFVGE